MCARDGASRLCDGPPAPRRFLFHLFVGGAINRTIDVAQHWRAASPMLIVQQKLAALTFSVTHVRAGRSEQAVRWPTGAAPITFSPIRWRGDQPHHRRRPALAGSLADADRSAEIGRVNLLCHPCARGTERAGCAMAHRRRADFFFTYSLAGRSTAPSTSPSIG